MYAVTKCNEGTISLLGSKGKKIEVEFVDKDITSDAGILLAREVDKVIGLTNAASKGLNDKRDQTRIEHSIEEMLQQRIYALVMGYEDLNDHNSLRNDLAVQVSVDKPSSLASPSTLCRFENNITHEENIHMSKIMVDKFIQSYKKAPKEITIDADPTDDAAHGNQENNYYHGYYKHYCFLPLHIYCGNHLLVSYLRPSNIDGAKHVGAIMTLLVKYIRRFWPNTKIIFRADGGLCRDHILRWFERNNVSYIVGYTCNSRIIKATKGLMARAAVDYEKTGEKQKLFDQIYYSAHTWKSGDRKVIVKAEYGELGKNLRCIITTLEDLPKELYEYYCLRGDMENRIKELKLDCYSGRTSCHGWEANQFRLLLSSYAYILLDSIRRLALKSTNLKNATCATIRTSLLKVGALITVTSRRIHFAISKYFAKKEIFATAAKNLILLH